MVFICIKIIRQSCQKLGSENEFFSSIYKQSINSFSKADISDEQRLRTIRNSLKLDLLTQHFKVKISTASSCRRYLSMDGAMINNIRAIWYSYKMIAYIMIDYGLFMMIYKPSKLIYSSVHIDRVYHFIRDHFSRIPLYTYISCNGIRY